MNSFTEAIKAEAAASIGNKKKSDACLLGMLALSETAEDQSVVFTTDCEVTHNLFLRLVGHIVNNPESISEDVIRHRGKLPTYRVKLSGGNSLELIKKRLNIKSFDCDSVFSAGEKLSDSSFGAFVAGIYLSCGRTDDPAKRYSLEFVPDRADSGDICRALGNILAKRVELSPKFSAKNGQEYLYFRDSVSVEDVLTLIGATRATLQIMQTKVYKDIRNRANRVTNCDTANCDRQNASTARQLEAVREIMSLSGLGSLSDELREAAELRLKYPDYSLTELAGMFEPPLSKSGANHRFKKLIELCEQIKQAREG